MSLHQLAQAVQSRGRGEDSVLIHMTPKEVGGLQALAMANGGSLTTNPDTGLPEAGFLSNLLPTLIGAGLSIASGGALTPLMTAGLMGGGTALLTGDLRKGLMAGLGAYGGAGLGAGLTGAGAAGAQQAAMQEAAKQAATQGATGAAADIATAMPAFDPVAGTMVNEGMVGGAAGAQNAARAMAQSNAAVEATRQFMPPEVSAQMGQRMATPSAIQTTTQMPVMDRVGAGFQALGTESGREAALQAMGGGKQAIKYGLAAAAPMMEPAPMGEAPVDDERYLYNFEREQTSGDPLEPSSRQRRYFTDARLTRIPGFAEGGETRDPTESEAIFDYLMGRRSASRLPPPAAAPVPAVQPRGFLQNLAGFVKSGAPLPPGVMGGGFFGAPGAASTTSASAIDASRNDGGVPTFRYDPRTGGLAAIALPKPVKPAPAQRVAQERSGNYRSGNGYSGPSGGLNNSAGDGYGDGTSYAAQGGLVGLARGGLASGGFVVPADVVSMLGEGSTDAGVRALRAKFGAVQAIKGPGTGQSDSIKTTIEGRQPARVADGEAYIPPEVVRKHGGAKKFYAMLDRVRAASQGHTKQQRRVNPDQVMA